MAIDSEVKRKSIAGVAQFFRPRIVVPDSTIDNPDRQAIGWVYAGISAAGVNAMALARQTFRFVVSRVFGRVN